MRELNLTAAVEDLNRVIDFVETYLKESGCPMAEQLQIIIAVEELYVNVAHYAYAPEVGPATIRMEVSQSPAAASITLIDQGKPYNPLAREDPDVTLTAEERGIGGLGIYMVKQTMDEVRYEYKEGRNILTIVKGW